MAAILDNHSHIVEAGVYSGLWAQHTANFSQDHYKLKKTLPELISSYMVSYHWNNVDSSPHSQTLMLMHGCQHIRQTYQHVWRLITRRWIPSRLKYCWYLKMHTYYKMAMENSCQCTQPSGQPSFILSGQFYLQRTLRCLFSNLSS